MTSTLPDMPDRRSGIAVWRQIADRLRQEIAAGQPAEGERLPPENTLSERFGVNRHTVRAAIAALVAEGVVTTRQGHGSTVTKRSRLTYPISRRTRFSEGLAGQARQTSARLLDAAVEAADPIVAEGLALPAGAAVLRLRTLSEADGWPIALATHWFEAKRFSGMEQALATTGSITRALRQFGVSDYSRKFTSITAAHADSGQLEDLRLSPGAIMLVTTAINEDVRSHPIQFSRTLFAADRVELTIDGPSGPARHLASDAKSR